MNLALQIMYSKKTYIPGNFNPGIFNPLYLIRISLLKNFIQLIPELQGKLLDFGCGSKPYESLFKTEEYIGVDFRGEGETYPKDKVNFFYDGKTLPFPDNSFDSVFSSEVFEHIFNLEEILKELNRVLKTRGKILISCPFAFPEHEVPNDFARYTSFALKSLFEANGFKIVQQLKTGSYPEAITQLKIIYWDKYMLSYLNKIPGVRFFCRHTIYFLFNISAVTKRKILPFRNDLYLSNIILAEKVTAI